MHYCAQRFLHEFLRSWFKHMMIACAHHDCPGYPGQSTQSDSHVGGQHDVSENALLMGWKVFSQNLVLWQGIFDDSHLKSSTNTPHFKLQGPLPRHLTDDMNILAFASFVSRWLFSKFLCETVFLYYIVWSILASAL